MGVESGPPASGVLGLRRTVANPEWLGGLSTAIGHSLAAVHTRALRVRATLSLKEIARN
jgi:hypothetical protein